MATVEVDFRSLLAAHAPLTALVSTRIALNAVPEDSAYPLVVFAAIHNRTLGLNNSLLADMCSLEVQCWAEAAAQADAVADAVISAVSLAPAAAGAVVTSRASTFDPETGLDGVLLTVEWWA
jgi:hypothetical protein